MKLLGFAQVATMLLGTALAQSEEIRAKYQRWTDVCDRFGYEWEPHVVETEDGWTLTVFRITAVKGKALPEDPTKPPILIMHGAGQASHDWLGFNPLGPTLIG